MEKVDVHNEEKAMPLHAPDPDIPDNPDVISNVDNDEDKQS